jgi:hypothetical protein
LVASFKLELRQHVLLINILGISSIYQEPVIFIAIFKLIVVVCRYYHQGIEKNMQAENHRNARES